MSTKSKTLKQPENTGQSTPRLRLMGFREYHWIGFATGRVFIGSVLDLMVNSVYTLTIPTYDLPTYAVQSIYYDVGSKADDERWGNRERNAAKRWQFLFWNFLVWREKSLICCTDKDLTNSRICQHPLLFMDLRTKLLLTIHNFKSLQKQVWDFCISHVKYLNFILSHF